jgi:hypothetical protein
LGEVSAQALTPEQFAEVRIALAQARHWAPKARQELNGYLNAIGSGKKGSTRVSKALNDRFGWQQGQDDPAYLSEIKSHLGELVEMLRREHAPRYVPRRVQTPDGEAWVRARPGEQTISVYPDFFSNFDANGTATVPRSREDLAVTLMHELLHRLDRPGGGIWDDQPSGLDIRAYVTNPSSYAKFVRDVAGPK